MILVWLFEIVLVACILWMLWRLASSAWKFASVKDKLEDVETEKQLSELVKNVKANDIEAARSILDNFEKITKKEKE